jgi:hypothetical protein
LEGLRFAVLALGDYNDANFRKAGGREDDFLETTRSNPLVMALQPCLACWHLTLASTTDCDRSDEYILDEDRTPFT